MAPFLISSISPSVLIFPRVSTTCETVCQVFCRLYHRERGVTGHGPRLLSTGRLYFLTPLLKKNSQNVIDVWANNQKGESEMVFVPRAIPGSVFRIVSALFYTRCVFHSVKSLSRYLSLDDPAKVSQKYNGEYNGTCL